MNRRILSAIVAVLGLVVIGLAVASATVWRPSSTAQTTMAQTPTSSYVVTAPGVLGAVDSQVTITATAADKDSPVVVAVGRSEDVTAWLASDPYTEITGLSDWETLASTEVTQTCPSDATGAPSDATSGAATDAATTEATAGATASAGCTTLEATGADPTGSDLWLTQETGTGSATLTVDASDPDLVALVATDGTAAAPDVSLSWPRAVSTPWLVPGLVLGGLLVLVGIFVLVLDVQLRRQAAERRARAAERAARRAAADATATSVMPALGSDPDRPLTRREQREKERAESTGEEWVDPRTGAVHRAGVEIPDVPQATAVVPGAELPEADGALEPGEDAGATAVLAVPDDAPGAGTVRDEVAGGGSAVVPGLDDDATAAYRESRELEDDTPFTLTDGAPEGGPATDAGADGRASDAVQAVEAATTEMPAVGAPLPGEDGSHTEETGTAGGGGSLRSQDTPTEPTDNPEEQA